MDDDTTIPFIQHCREGSIEDVTTMLPRVTDHTAMAGVYAGWATNKIDIIRLIVQERPSIRDHIDYESLVVHCYRGKGDIRWAIDGLTTEGIRKARNFIYLPDEIKALLTEELERRIEN